MKSRMVTSAWFFVFFGLVLASPVWAAINRGTIRGTVADAQGSVVVNVNVKASNVATGTQQATRSDSAGLYVIPELVPGTYDVHVEMPGFAPVDITGVIVKANDVATVDVRLEVGRVAQSIEVRATNPLVETTASNFSVPLSQKYMEDLPIMGRDIQGLVQLIPGVTQSNGPPGSLVAFNSSYGGFPDSTHTLGSWVAINGSQAAANAWYLDGSLNSSEGVDAPVVNPVPEAVSEFQAVTGSLAAEYGRAAGAVFNVVLKSGTNQPHGSVYEYNRNSYFHARDPFAQVDANGNLASPKYVNWNQFGGTIGGPIVLPHIYNGKNRSFFFASWDVSLLHASQPGVFTVPTALEHSGNFSDDQNIKAFGIYDPLSTKYVPNNPQYPSLYRRQPFLNPDGTLATTLPASRLDPTAKFLVDQFPMPNYLDPRQQNEALGGCLNTCNNLLGRIGQSQTTHNVIAKVDHQVSDKHKLFVEWLYNPGYNSIYELPWTGATALQTGLPPYLVRNQIAALGDTLTLSPTLVNEARFMFSRQPVIPTPINYSLYGVQDTLQHVKGLNIPAYPPLAPTPGWFVGPYSFGLGYAVYTDKQTSDAFTVIDNLTKVFSKHTMKAGFSFRNDRTAFLGSPKAALSFGGGLVTNPNTGHGGDALAQFELGAVDQSSQYWHYPQIYWTNHIWSWYIQDDYRITRKLTVSLGLRHDVYEWYKEKHDRMSIFNLSVPNPLDSIRLGRVDYMSSPQHPSRVMYPANKNDFQPRLNFAYSPFADGKTVIRGGIDLINTNGFSPEFGAGNGPFYSPGYTVVQDWSAFDATGGGLAHTYNVPAFILTQGAPSLPLVNPNPKATDAQFMGPQTSFLAYESRNTHDPTVYLWNLQIQRQLPGNMAVVAGYVGSQGRHLVSDPLRPQQWVSVANIQKYRTGINAIVSTPADLVPYFGSSYPQSQFLLPFPEYTGGPEQLFSSDGNSSYNGLQVKVEKKFSHGLDFLAAYTAQKTMTSPNLGGYLTSLEYSRGGGRISQISSGLSYNFFNSGFQNPDNRAEDRALAPDDTPQIFNFSWTYELPFGPGKAFGGHAGRIPSLLAEGWKLSGSFNAQTGIPLGFTGPGNYVTSRPNLIGNPSAGQSRKTRTQLEQQWFNPNAFEPVFGSDPKLIYALTHGVYPDGTPFDPNKVDALWRFGTAGLRLGDARSPGFWGSDMALVKDFKVSESKYFQLRIEGYNIFNHQNLALPNTNWCLPPNPDGSVDVVHQFGCQFGRISDVATDPRNWQFALKFVF